MADDPIKELQPSWGERVRRAALWVFFALMLLIPKTLALRRRPELWNGLRLLAAVVGALMVGSWKGPQESLGMAVGGLVLILSALLLRPVREGKSVDEQARALGALVVVNGGRLQGLEGRPVVRLFVTSERVHVLDRNHQRLLEVSLPTVASVRAEKADKGWRLVIEGNEARARFHYQGFFAEHLARVAESTLRSQLRRELPVVKG